MFYPSLCYAPLFRNSNSLCIQNYKTHVSLLAAFSAYMGFHVVCCASFYGVHMHYNSHDYFLLFNFKWVCLSHRPPWIIISSQGSKGHSGRILIFFESQLSGIELDTLIKIISFNPHINPPTNEETEAQKDGLTSHNHPAESASELRCVRFLNTAACPMASSCSSNIP